VRLLTDCQWVDWTHWSEVTNVGWPTSSKVVLLVVVRFECAVGACDWLTQFDEWRNEFARRKASSACSLYSVTVCMPGLWTGLWPGIAAVTARCDISDVNSSCRVVSAPHVATTHTWELLDNDQDTRLAPALPLSAPLSLVYDTNRQPRKFLSQRKNIRVCTCLSPCTIFNPFPFYTPPFSVDANESGNRYRSES